MSRRILTCIGCCLAGAAALVIQLRREPSRPAPEAAAPAEAPPVIAEADPAEIFRRAFWKRPSAEDDILHSQRQEWREGSDVRRTRWYLAVRPSTALRAHLIGDNAFGLVKRSDMRAIPGAPSWFTAAPAGAVILGAADDGMVLFYQEKENLLLASGTTAAFRRGAPAPAPAPSESLTRTGRLPLTSPSPVSRP